MSGYVYSVAHQTSHFLCSVETKGGFNMKNFTEDARS